MSTPHPNPISIKIVAVVHADVPHMAKVAGDAFEDDRHTLMKNQGAVPYDMYVKPSLPTHHKPRFPPPNGSSIPYVRIHKIDK
jgi:hypothetical protein